jgi:Na+/H+ antiporter NhaB
LFKLATASVFWVLLELGSERQKLKTETLKAEMEKQEMFATKEHKEHKENSDSSFRSFLRSLRFFAAIKPAIGNRKFAIDRSLMTSAATK